jgi:hypothetical protein
MKAMILSTVSQAMKLVYILTTYVRCFKAESVPRMKSVTCEVQ